MISRFAGVAGIALVALSGFSPLSHAESGGEIHRGVGMTLERFYSRVRGGEQLASKARAVLVFPSIVKAGFGVGGEYGEGELRIRGANAGFYNSVSASIGFQLGVEQRSVLIFFMTDSALDQFRNTKGWKVGVDGSVAILTVGAGGSVDTNKISSPVVGFILDPKGLMYNLTLEGSKISRIEK
jgi:lipid-binding SYLF domain-containing protein